MLFRSLESRSVASLATLYIVRMLGLFMVLPVLALAGNEYSGSNVFLLGLAIGVYGLSQALLQIPFGFLSDRYGRKPMIALGLIIFASGTLIAATSGSIEGLIIGRILQGAGAIAGVVMAMVADLTSEKNRSKAMASIGASIGVAFALSLVIGPLLMAIGGIRWIFWVTLILTLVALVILFRWVPQAPKPDATHRLSVKDIVSLARTPELLPLNVGIFTLHCVLMALFVALPSLLIQVDIKQANHAFFYLFVMVGSFCLMVPMLIFSERKKRVKVTFLFALAFAMSSLLLLSFFHQDQVLVALWIFGFFLGFNYLEATLPSLMSKTVSQKLRGAGSGLFSTCQFLGAGCGGLLGGIIYKHYELQTLLLVCTFLLLLWWLIALSLQIPQAAQIEAENVVA